MGISPLEVVGPIVSVTGGVNHNEDDSVLEPLKESDDENDSSDDTGCDTEIYVSSSDSDSSVGDDPSIEPLPEERGHISVVSQMPEPHYLGSDKLEPSRDFFAFILILIVILLMFIAVMLIVIVIYK
ncbi:hypothetical protein [Cacatuid alphaherpesvirus 2]|uniref:Uncharacterized protein n=1 Tax=Cacatuid alphaherpesvirus 2 TaxID=2604840 RepID=A0A5B9R428_9ALPH|nr:hypothetical protein QKT46_gp04 [Cacatuid alphaherpesvirus 2]QEG54109.1 hypothetical protein [Cacatuid alphaherpesvirus 2]